MTSLILKPFILLWSLLVMVQMVKCANPKCPRYCKCDVYRRLNRAECSSRRLIRADVKIPHKVQILDLSINNITTIETKSFQSYNDLVSLNLSRNNIYGLEMESFSQLHRIREIDLSHNRIEYLDDRTFETNRKLQKLNLEGNEFKAFARRPFLKSSSLKQLNLRNCQITFINKSLFSQLPNLEELNLAENLINNFLPQEFYALVKLRILNLSNNPMRCDISMQKKLQQMQDNGIKVTMAECKMSQTPAMVGRKYPKEKAIPNQLPQPKDNGLLKQWHWSETIDKYFLIIACTLTIGIIKLTFVFLVPQCKQKVQSTMDAEPLGISAQPLANPHQQLPVDDGRERECHANISIEVVGIENDLDNDLDTEDTCP